MIFALSTLDCTLHVYPSEEEAVLRIEAIEVEQGGWLFFDAAGHVMEPVFSSSGRDGAFAALNSGAGYCLITVPGNPIELLGLLPTVSAVEGRAPFDNVERVEELLIFHAGEPPAGNLQ